MSDTTLQLKRKRESLGGQQKKVKKSRKSESIVEQDTENVTTNGAPAAEPISAAHLSKQKSKIKSKSIVEKPQINGTRDDAPIELPERKNKKKDKQAVNSEEKAQADAAESKELVKADSPDSTRSQPKTKKRSKNAPKWSISPVQGGWFLPLDPVFSSDEKYLLLATLKSLQVYATETSLLANTLPVGGTGVVITAYALSTTKSNQVYVADSTGLITLWNWVDGKKIGRWDIGATVRNMAVVVQPGTDDDIVYCYEVSDGKHIVDVHALRTKEQPSKTELKRVIKSTSAIHSFQILLQGKYVVIATIDSITIGKRLKTSKTALQDFEYVWREFQFSKHITTFNTYFRPQQVTEKSKKSDQDQRDVLDLAVGDESGVILLFEDILASFAALEKNQKSNPNKTDSADSLRPKRLHWHREAVGSVKWSLDGNYVVSGGDETVLTIWQLATGKSQHLPHLTAAIENVVVSPTGTSYAVMLANNSVIVLSTTELDAKTNIIGIQSRRVDVEHMPRDSTASQTYLKPFRRIPTAIDPKDGKLLISVPSSQPRLKTQGIHTQPYLQAYDVPNNRPIARQALTRNNATDPNMAPEGGRILEPDVKSIQVSHDGEWLASVEEWLPPRADTGFLDEGVEEFNEQERLLRREVFLKFWRWHAKTEEWALEGRQDAPHFFEDAGGNARVLDLVSDPVTYGFATIGEDHIVRIWKPKSRLREGIVVRGADNKGLVNWSLEHSIVLPKDDASDASSNVRQLRRTSRLAWSADGSILIAASSGAEEDASTPIHLIDPSEGVIRQSITEIDTTGLSHVGIVDRHMVVVAQCVTVWDMIGHRPVYFAPIDTPGIDSTERASVIRFAVNAQSGSFAISLPLFEKKEGSRSKKATSKVSIHNTTQAEPLWSHTLAGIILGLTADSEKGYVALDSNSCVRTISPNVTQALLAPPTDDRTETLSIEEINGFEDIKEEGERKEILLDDEYDRPVVTQQDLEKIFHNGNALPAPRDMFSAVLKLFGGVAGKAT